MNTPTNEDNFCARLPWGRPLSLAVFFFKTTIGSIVQFICPELPVNTTCRGTLPLTCLLNKLSYHYMLLERTLWLASILRSFTRENLTQDAPTMEPNFRKTKRHKKVYCRKRSLPKLLLPIPFRNIYAYLGIFNRLNYIILLRM